MLRVNAVLRVLWLGLPGAFIVKLVRSFFHDWDNWFSLLLPLPGWHSPIHRDSLIGLRASLLQWLWHWLCLSKSFLHAAVQLLQLWIHRRSRTKPWKTTLASSTKPTRTGRAVGGDCKFRATHYTMTSVKLIFTGSRWVVQMRDWSAPKTLKTSCSLLELAWRAKKEMITTSNAVIEWIKVVTKRDNSPRFTIQSGTLGITSAHSVQATVTPSPLKIRNIWQR